MSPHCGLPATRTPISEIMFFSLYTTRLSAVALVLVLLLLPSTFAYWTDSVCGPDDEIGAANLITKDSVLRAVQMIKKGKTYSLGIVIDSETPSVSPRTLSLTILQPAQVGRVGVRGFGTNRVTFNDDILFAWLGTGSQIDGLGHIGIGSLLYNGFNRSVVAETTGLTKLGLEKLPPIVARGVLLDMAAYFGKEIVEEGTAYTKEDIKRAAEQQGVKIRKRDVVLFHSGWLNLLDQGEEAKKRFITAEPGLGVSGASYLIKKGVMAVGADSWGVEVVPFENSNEFFPVHAMLLPRNGIFVLESMDTRAMVNDKVREFMFVLGVTRIRGAVQMMINPTAIA